MEKYKYCGQYADYIHNEHQEYNNESFIRKEDFYLKDKEIQTIAKNSFIDIHSLQQIYCKPFDETIERYLDDGIIETQEKNLRYGISNIQDCHKTSLMDISHLKKSFNQKLLLGNSTL